MLELNQITKQYNVGDNTVHALKGVDLKFRTSEFVSILGPSGCGKTTLLNIIGGLDKYTSGDLIIDGVSTKQYGDRDWDTYRNHSIGFVFQSYYLIPHQTVLQNVEMTLTLSGVSKAERRERAIEALKAVGLEAQMNKRPNQMSGGQMQRVAIARALVNNPDIILADEPTGALDTETSIQVMEILKEVSKDRLVLMVTHNPDLAEQYSSRIIRMLDGEIIGDSAPLDEAEIKAEVEHDIRQKEEKKNEKSKKSTMSFWTAFKLSLKNLFTKKGRTFLTSFAGSIGIIGIALILAVSQGTTNYINTVQEQTLSSYPLTIQSQTVDLMSLITSVSAAGENKHEHDKDAVYNNSTMLDIMNAVLSIETNDNDLKSFKKHLESEMDKEDSALNKAIAGLHYSYDLDMLVYTTNVDGEIMRSDVHDLIMELMGIYMDSNSSLDNGQLSAMSSFNMTVWEEMLPGKNGKLISDMLEKQYDVVYGSWPNSYDEIVIVLDKNNEIDDISLYTLGLFGQEQIDQIADAIRNGTEIDASLKRWSYEELCGENVDCRILLNSECFRKNELTGLWYDFSESEDMLDKSRFERLYNDATKLKITGIIRPKQDATSTMLTGAIGYTSALTEHVISQMENTAAVKAQKENPNIDIFTGLPFAGSVKFDSDEQKAEAFRKYINDLDTEGKADAYLKIKSIVPQEVIDKQINDLTKESLIQYSVAMGMDTAQIEAYLAPMSEEEFINFKKLMRPYLEDAIKTQYAEKVGAMIDANLPGDKNKADALMAEMPGFTTAQCVVYYDEVVEFSSSDYEQNMKILGCIDLESPDAMSIYASSFADKETISSAIDEYNRTRKDDSEKINYTDFVALMMTAVTTIIDAITYVLIAFVAISLIVSSIMVGVITLISVQERTKEIGILRAIGASKSDVSHMFNAETIIIGFAAGLFGVLVTYLLCLPINLILHVLTGINSLNAVLPPLAALILVLISMLLTVFSGFIPSRSAAKKDPAVALRTE